MRLELVLTRLFLGVAEVKVCEELTESPHLRDGARVWDVLGNVYRRDGQPQKALEAFEQALARETDRSNHSSHETNIAQLKALLGDVAGADAGLLEAIERTRNSGNRRKLAAALANLGQTMVNSGRAIAGQPYLEEAIELYREMGVLTGSARRF